MKMETQKHDPGAQDLTAHRLGLRHASQCKFGTRNEAQHAGVVFESGRESAVAASCASRLANSPEAGLRGKNPATSEC